MTKEERYQKTAEQLLKLVGGKENIISTLCNKTSIGFKR